MREILEMAERLGRSLGSTDEYRALRRALEATAEDRELSELQNRILDLERRFEEALRSGQQPPASEQQEYESLFSRLQSNPTYQRLVSAQANFDKIVARVNETIHQGIEKGAQSRIILT